MTTLSSHQVVSAVPIVPLAYRSNVDGGSSRLVRISGLLGLFGLGLVGMVIPLNYRTISPGYDKFITFFVPSLQLICLGAGIALFICGRRAVGPAGRKWCRLCFAILTMLAMVSLIQVAALADRASRPSYRYVALPPGI